MAQEPTKLVKTLVKDNLQPATAVTQGLVAGERKEYSEKEEAEFEENSRRYFLKLLTEVNQLMERTGSGILRPNTPAQASNPIIFSWHNLLSHVIVEATPWWTGKKSISWKSIENTPRQGEGDKSAEWEHERGLRDQADTATKACTRDLCALIEKIASACPKATFEYIPETGPMKDETILYYLSRHGVVIQALLMRAEAHTLNWQKAADRNNTALIIAAHGGHAYVVKALINAGASIDIKNSVTRYVQVVDYQRFMQVREGIPSRTRMLEGIGTLEPSAVGTQRVYYTYNDKTNLETGTDYPGGMTAGLAANYPESVYEGHSCPSNSDLEQTREYLWNAGSLFYFAKGWGYEVQEQPGLNPLGVRSDWTNIADKPNAIARGRRLLRDGASLHQRDTEGRSPYDYACLELVNSGGTPVQAYVFNQGSFSQQIKQFLEPPKRPLPLSDAEFIKQELDKLNKTSTSTASSATSQSTAASPSAPTSAVSLASFSAGRPIIHSAQLPPTAAPVSSSNQPGHSSSLSDLKKRR